MQIIDSFDGEYRWLSNFWIVPVTYEDESYMTTEHAYQAAKTINLYERYLVQICATPGKAKVMGRKVTIREDWDSVKIEVMRDLTNQKYNVPQLRDKLLATGNAQIVEGNTWGDTFWGLCNGKGHNHLGRLIMEKRAQLKFEMENK